MEGFLEYRDREAEDGSVMGFCEYQERRADGM